MTGFETYRLPAIPQHLHFPRACEPYIAHILDGAADTGADRWPLHVNPDHVLRGLQWHGIGPVLYQRCKQHAELDTLPPWLRDYLRQSYERSAAANLAIGAELVELADALSQARAPAILLKGSALMRTGYEQAGLRPMVDVDLLVRPQDMDQACIVLSRAGYRALAARKHVAKEHHLQFIRTGGPNAGLFIELHWRLSDQEALADLLPLADLWSRSVPAPHPWGAARTFDLCDQMLHVTLHLAEHYGLPQLRRLCDLHKLSLPIDRDDAWQTLARRAVQCDLHLVLAAGLQEARRWFATEVPEGFWRELTAGLPASRAAERAFARCGEPSLVEFEMQELRSIRTLRGKMAHVLSLLFPDARFVRRRHRVPRDSAVWPYYLLRLGNGLRTGVRSILHRPSGVARAKSANSAEHRLPLGSD